MKIMFMEIWIIKCFSEKELCVNVTPLCTSIYNVDACLGELFIIHERCVRRSHFMTFMIKMKKKIKH